MKLFRLIFIFLLLLNISYSLRSQSVDELSKKRQEIERNISNISNLIEETSKKKDLTANNLRLINQKIGYKKNLVAQIDNEIEFLNNEIYFSQLKIDSLDNEVNLKRNELATILQVKFKNRGKVSLIMFILASNSFNQAYNRAKLYNNLVDYQKKCIDDLKVLIADVNTNKLNLQTNYKALKLKQAEKQMELSGLETDSKVYSQKVKDIKLKEKDLRTELLNEKRKSDLISGQIRRIMEEERRRMSKSSSGIASGGELLSKQFKDNIGRFSPPVMNGVITSNYGESFHPYLKGVKVKNNGIDISVSGHSNVYCIFDGEVKKIFNVPLSGLAVIVRHGSYLTVYSNLSNLEVKVGDVIKTNQKIGIVTDMDGTVGLLHFEIWNERTTEDPALWVKGYNAR